MEHGDGRDANLVVQETLGVESGRPWLAIRTMRQFGKTKTLEMFVAAVLACVPDINMVLVSTNIRHSFSVIRNIRRQIKEYATVRVPQCVSRSCTHGTM